MPGMKNEISYLVFCVLQWNLSVWKKIPDLCVCNNLYQILSSRISLRVLNFEKKMKEGLPRSFKVILPHSARQSYTEKLRQ